ncbi:hypothetical protein Sjap_013077 [Stephania japonica]|uniref:Uncharacterized protein n=1 Tax=Stephania japonica TaxID=461633 RepID=A0AAP0NZI8_9MAGN
MGRYEGGYASRRHMNEETPINISLLFIFFIFATILYFMFIAVGLQFSSS